METSHINKIPEDAEAKNTLPMWATPPWPEWNDSDIRTEIWETDAEEESSEEQPLFVDPTGELLPPSIKPTKWIRPDSLEDPPKLIEWNNAPKIDLINPNIHLCQEVDLIRFILSEISELYDYGAQNMFQLEGEGICFAPNSSTSSTSSWRPFDNIYSDCEAGVKDDQPTLNRIGKYYVRLYYMGSWRRITVDDRIPVLKDGMLGLPITQYNEIWPAILIKALFKIAALTWEYDTGVGIGKIQTFSTIAALTGWVHEWVDIPEPISSTDLWDQLGNILPKYDGKVPTKINYWTTGKTKKQRMVKEEGDPVVEKVVNYEDEMNWWTLVQDEEDILDTEYLDCSDSEMPTTAATSLPNDSDFLETSAAQSVFSVSEMEAADEAEEWELEEMQKRQEDNGGSSRKSKLNKEKKRGGNDSSSEMRGSVSEGQPELEAADEVDTEKRPSKSTKPKKKTLKKSTKSRQISSINIEGVENAESKQNVKKNKKGKKDQDLKKKQSARNLKSPSDDEEEEDIENAFADEEEETEIGGSENKRLSFMTGNGTLESDRSQKPKTPKMRDILLGVQKYLAPENYPLITKWESKCGSCVPDVINVILMIYPRPESGPFIPSFLYHPINVVEIRDTPLKKGPNRPTTPLWKTFRWKKWAMKKGIIPMEFPLDKIRSIKVTTPFGLKREWNRARHHGTNRIKFLSSGGENEEVGEYYGEEICGGGGEGSEFGDQEEGSFQGEFSTQASSSPNGDLTKEKKSSQRKISEEKEKSKQDIKGSKDIKRPSLAARKLSRASTFMILDKNSSNMLEHAAKNFSQHKMKSLKSKKGKWKEALKSLTIDTNEEEETIMIEDEEEIGPEKDITTEGPGQPEVIPPLAPFATSSVWFQCDSVAPYIRKMCKFYSSRPIFGSCFVLNRTLNYERDFNDTGNVPIIINDDVAVSQTLTLKSQKELVDFHSDQNSFNLTLRFDTFNILPITDSHLDNSNNKFNSGFYIFTDCWTEQEIIISLELLQANDIAKFPILVPPGPEKNESNNTFKVGFLIEPWDWTNHDNFTIEPVVQCVADKNWTTFLTLHPGRNIFRISITENPKEQDDTTLLDTQEPEEKNSKEENVTPQENEEIRLNVTDVETFPASIFTQYSWKLTSRTPIHVGTRNEVLNYMTNEPVLLLKQCERIAQNIWTMFLFFGKHKAVYAQNFQSLRKSYCPSDSDIVKVKGIHSTFEDYFVEMIRDMNNGKLEPKMLLALKCLFLNPLLGQNLPQLDKEPPTVELTRPSLTTDAAVVDAQEQDIKVDTVEEFSTAKVIAVLTIQRFCRGWLVRRLFQLRTKGTSKFLKMEYQVRKIAYILACHTASEFSRGMENITDQPEVATDKINIKKSPSINLITETNEDEYENNFGSEEEEHDQLLQPNVTPEIPHNNTEALNDANEPTLVPNPPKWTVKLLKRLFDTYPLLVTKHPHASSVPNHVKIREIEGTIPNVLNDKNCAPFYRRIVTLVGEQPSCCCIIQLEVIPKTPVMMKIINNDDHAHPIETQTDHYFAGNLMANKTGYAIICYRLIPKKEESEESSHHDGIPLFHNWKVRIITSKNLDCLVFKDEVHHIHHHHHHHNQEEGTNQTDQRHLNQDVPLIQTSSNHEHKAVINVTNEIPDLTNTKVE